MKNTIKLSLAFVFTIVLSISSFASVSIDAANAAEKAITQAHKWEKLGSRKVNMRADHDEIPVTVTEGFFTKVKFVVREAPIFIHNVKIVFGNGEEKNIVINRRIAKGTESKVIDLPGNKRIIKKVKMNYKSVPNGNGRATVVLWGKH